MLQQQYKHIVLFHMRNYMIRRYSTKALLVELFQKLRAHFVGLAGGSEECSEFLLGRGSATTSGVEGFFTPDGVQIAHMFLWRAEGPNYVVDMVNHFLVRAAFVTYLQPSTVRSIWIWFRVSVRTGLR